ncbi:MAG: glycoside hydrolase family 99-like domain-containing protein [Desulfurivibrionaceae bacterium]
MKARAIAFYLPQFHPIPENDLWWGKGFMEWTNVTKAKPLFRGHLQPKLPADLGFYDLRVPETRIAQADLARENGIEGFCYWHYWFGNGKMLLERPFQEVLRSGEPDFPFCLAWANQTWTGVWHGAPNRVLVEQTYPGMEDYKQHFYKMLPAFEDPRYIRVDGLPLFLVYAPGELPDARQFTDCWRELALKEGLGGIHLMAVAHKGWQPEDHGFDSATFHPPLALKRKNKATGLLSNLLGHKKPEIIRYEEFIAEFRYDINLEECYFPTVLPNWDNTPRSGSNGVVLKDSTPELFGKHLENAIKAVDNRPSERRIVFIKSWNEWAEGNYLEPDTNFGHEYLDVIKSLAIG